jgi:hypothetical protein
VPSATVFNTTAATQHMDLGGSGLWDSILVGANRTGLATVSYWIKGPINAGYAGFWAMGTTGSNGVTHAAYRVGTSQRINVTFGSTNEYKRFTMPTGIDLDEDNWFHITILYPAGTVTDSSGTAAGNGLQDIELYVNAQPCGTDYNTGADGALSSWGSSNKGINIYSSQFLTSRSNVQIWNSVLTGTEITTLYNNGSPYLGTQPQAANLKGWWKMNVDTSNWNGSDWEIGDARSSYTSSIATTNGGFVTPNTNLSDFMGNSATNFSWSMWVRNTAGDTSASGLVKWSYPAASLYYNSIVNYNFYGGIALVLNATNRIGVTTINDGKWKHILITVDTNAGSNWEDVVKCFINGQSQSHNPSKTTGSPPASFDWLATFNGNPSNQRRVNVGSGGNSNSFHGDISNFTLYNSTLGQTEATALYNNGTPVTTAVGSPTAWWKVNNLTSGLLDVSENSYDITTEGVGQVVTDGLVSALNGESSGMTTANLVNSDLERSIPYSSYSMVFDAAGTDRINIGNPTELQITSNLSISIWVKQTTVQDAIVICKDSAGAGTRSWSLWTNAYQASNVAQFLVFRSDNTACFVDSTTRVDDGNWHHIICTYEPSTAVKIYIDGQLEGTNTVDVPSSIPNTSANVIIGEWYAAGSFEFPGNISNAAIFDSTLTKDQVLTIYNGGVPNDISSLSPVGWWSLGGDSYYASDWICPDLGSGGNNGTSANLAATALVGNGPGSEANGVGTSMNIPGNLQGNAPNSTANAFSININAADRVEDVAPSP